MEKITKADAIELATTKKIELREKFGKEVYSLVYAVEDSEEEIKLEDETTSYKYDWLIGYFIKPSRLMQMQIADQSFMNGKYTFIGLEFFNSCVVKDETDKRFFSEDEKYDSILLDTYRQVVNSVKFSQNAEKKTGK